MRRKKFVCKMTAAFLSAGRGAQICFDGIGMCLLCREENKEKAKEFEGFSAICLYLGKEW